MQQHEITYNIKSDSKKIYAQFLAIINNVFFYEIDADGNTETSPLTNRELSVLALYMYYNFLYKNLPQEARREWLNSSTIRNKIKNELQISTGNLNGILLRLSNKFKFPDKEPVFNQGSLCKSLDDIELTDNMSLNFKFKYVQG